MVDVVDGLPYRVIIEGGALGRLGEVVGAVTPGNTVVVISDATVAKLYGERAASVASADIMAAALDEKHKTRAAWGLLTDRLLEKQCGRDTTLVALGGGVVGDIVGFVAATYMRGIPYIQVPTTLLAMVDASVGGKTGVDTPAGKNLVGAFHQPAAVLIDPELLQTLPVDQLRAGYAEVIKHGVVADADYFAQVVSTADAGALRDSSQLHRLGPIIERSVAIKASIVSRDEREAGLRKVLNFGHTIGHAIEAATSYSMLHGNAIAIGMVIEARIAERIGVAKPGLADAVTKACQAASLAVEPPQTKELSARAILSFTHADKKKRAGQVEYALPRRVGEMAGADRGWSVPVDDTVVLDALGAALRR